MFRKLFGDHLVQFVLLIATEKTQPTTAVTPFIQITYAAGGVPYRGSPSLLLLSNPGQSNPKSDSARGAEQRSFADNHALRGAGQRRGAAIELHNSTLQTETRSWPRWDKMFGTRCGS